MKLSREALGLALGLIGVVLFAGTVPATRLGVATLDPWFVTSARAGLAGLLAGATLLIFRRPWPNAALTRTLLFAGLLQTLVFPILMAFAMKTLPAAHGGIVLGLLPLLTAGIGAMLHGERPSPAFWGLSMTGAAIVIAFSLRDGGGELAQGDVFLFLSVVLSSLGNVISAGASRERPGWEITCWICVFMMPWSIPAMLLTAPADLAQGSAASWWGVAYLAIISQFFGFFAWNGALALGGVARVSQLQLLQTFVTLGMAALVNNEVITWHALAAATAIALLLLVQRRVRAA